MSEDLSIILERLKIQLDDIIHDYREQYKLPGYLLTRAFADVMIRLKDIEIMESTVQLDKAKKMLEDTVRQQAQMMQRKEVNDGEGVSEQS